MTDEELDEEARKCWEDCKVFGTGYFRDNGEAGIQYVPFFEAKRLLASGAILSALKYNPNVN